MNKVAAVGLPIVRQQTKNTCGVASVRAVLKHFRIPVLPEKDLANIAGTNDQGTTPESIIAVLKAHGLNAKLKQGMSLAELASHSAKNTPVIIAYQAWKDKSNNIPWEQDWKDGHYSVVQKVTNEHVVLNDPGMEGNRSHVMHEEFMKRWHDEDRNKKRYIRAGIVVTPMEKKAGQASAYDPPHNAEHLKKNYPQLLKDPTHRWRAETGIELMHKEPTKEEFERIWKNWQLMSPEQKKRSDQMAQKLTGMTNAEIYSKMKSSYAAKLKKQAEAVLPIDAPNIAMAATLKAGEVVNAAKPSLLNIDTRIKHLLPKVEGKYLKLPLK